MNQLDDSGDERDEVPVGELIVDLRSFEVQVPGKQAWAIEGDLGQGLIPEDDVRDLPLATVAEALGLLSKYCEDGAPEAWFLEIDPPNRIYELEVHDGLALESYGSDQLYVTVSIDLPTYADEAFEDSIEATVEPMLRYAGAVGRRSRVSPAFERTTMVMVRFEKQAGRTVGDLIRLGDDVRALLLAVRAGEPDEKVALNLVLAGHAATLVGQPESRWLDVKKQPWSLSSDTGKAEVAKDLSAMANAQGGLIVIPGRTTLVSGREVISEIRDIPLDRIDVTQIRDVLTHRVFPPLPDLVTEVVTTTDGRGVLVVAVGPHRPDNWPHHGEARRFRPRSEAPARQTGRVEQPNATGQASSRRLPDRGCAGCQVQAPEGRGFPPTISSARAAARLRGARAVRGNEKVDVKTNPHVVLSAARRGGCRIQEAG